MTSWINYLQVACFLVAATSTVLSQSTTSEIPPLERRRSWPPFEERFFLHTIDNPNGTYFDIQKKPDTFKKGAKTKIITHGFNGNKDDIQMIVNEYINKEDTNVLSFEWKFASHLPELQAAISALYLGRFIVGNFIPRLSKAFDVSYDDIHLIGYNMGAHLMGTAARSQFVYIGRVTGLDPYKNFFENSPLVNLPRLGADDAKFVDVYHTNINKFGISAPIGDIDFYPNGGLVQPKCEDDVVNEECSSLVSREYFAESIRYWDNFYAVECPNYTEFLNEMCLNNAVVVAGEFMNKTNLGIFYFRTGASFPYGMKRSGTVPRI